jgi:hypothetical protein
MNRIDKLIEQNDQLFIRLKKLPSFSSFNYAEKNLLNDYLSNLNEISLFENLGIIEDFERLRRLKLLTFRAITEITEKCLPSSTNSLLGKSPSVDINLFLRITNGGLTNRIRIICVIKTYLDLFGTNFKPSLLWIACKDCFVSIDEIFLVDKLNDHFNILNAEKYIDNVSIQRKNISFLEINELLSPWSFWIYNSLHKDGVTWGSFYESYKKNIRWFFSFIVKPSINQKANEFFFREFSHGVAFGVHIRTTDFLNHYKIKYPSLPLPHVVDFVNYLGSNSIKDNIFLCTDDPCLIDEFKTNFNKSFSCYSGDICNVSNRKSSVETALIDLLILSRCKNILGTFGSSFSQLASILRDAKLLHP